MDDSDESYTVHEQTIERAIRELVSATITPNKNERRPEIDRPTIARSTAVMSISTTLSRVTGFVRTWAIAYALGVTLFAASYGVANNIPNMIFELVAGGIISSLFIPIFLERWEQDSREDAWRFASSLFNIVTIVLSIIAVLGTVYAEAFVRTQTFRISPEEAELATYFFRFFAIQVVFYGSGSVISAILNSQRRYLWPALGPVFNNVVVIITLLGFYVPFHSSDPELAKMGLAIGTSLGVLAMFAVQIPSLIKLKPQYTFKIDLKHPGLLSMGKMAIPTLVYVVTNLIAVSFRNAYAFDVSPEGPATLLYAWMFYQLPYGIFAVALATAVFTELSDQAGRRDWPDFRVTFSKGLRTTSVLMLPMAAMLIALAEPLITLYRAGSFTAEDVPVVAEILAWWAAGLFFFAAYMFVLKTFYSLKDTKTPAIVNAIFTVVQITLYATLTVGIANWGGLGLKGIPIADGIFFAIALVALGWMLKRKVGDLGLRDIGSTVIKMFGVSIVGGLAAFGSLELMQGLSDITLGFLLQLVIGGVVGLGVAYGLAALIGVNEIAEGVGLMRKLWGRLPFVGR